jgi:hypothetical protein
MRCGIQIHGSFASLRMTILNLLIVNSGKTGLQSAKVLPHPLERLVDILH